MTFAEIVSKLKSFGSLEPENEAFIILEELFGVTRASILSNKDKDYPSPKTAEVLEKRKDKTPIQYIFGKWQFMGKDFYVSKDCLIPRMDTEILVSRAINEAKDAHIVADFCTGSGCIGVSMLNFCPHIDKMLLYDISEGALKMAEKNAMCHGVYEKCSFIKTDILKEVPKQKFDMILSNPPYIPTKDIDSLADEVKKEPFIALDGGDDGLVFVRRLIDTYLDYLNDNGKMLIEFGFDQGEKIDALLKQNEKIKSYEFLKDYGGNIRCVVIYK